MRLRRFFSIALAAAAAVGAAPSAFSQTVRLDAGQVSGVRKDGVDGFLGIPYAAAPVGANRWRAPLPPAPWKGTLKADHFGPSCPQKIIPSLGAWTHEYLPSGATSEDCLTVNVWKPAGATRDLPVLVWIHGGGFTSGSASVPVYDGAVLARKGIIVVSINYRLGFLGAMASPEARATGGDFGLQDQIAALRWVKRNIGAFGGDPARVTISGQSAGAFSVHYLILSQQARGLFSRAILQSGVGLGVHLDLALAPRDVAERSAGAFLAAAGVKTLDEARKLSLDELSTAFAKVGGRPGSTDGARIGPYADGVVLPLDPAAAFRAGRYNDTPVMIGLTADEGSGLNPHYRSTDAALYKAFLARRFGALAPAVEEFYPAKEGESALPALTRDCGLAMMADWTRTREKTTRFPAFAYMWTHVEPGPESARYGAFHTSEVPYAFGTLDKAPDRPIAAVDWRLADMMQGYWVNFVKSGNPNGKGLPKWLPFGRDNHVEELGDRVGVYPRLDPAKNALLLKHAEGGGNLLAF